MSGLSDGEEMSQFLSMQRMGNRHIDTRIYVVLGSDSLMLEEVSALLGLHPTNGWSVGRDGGYGVSPCAIVDAVRHSSPKWNASRQSLARNGAPMRTSLDGTRRWRGPWQKGSYNNRRYSSNCEYSRGGHVSNPGRRLNLHINHGGRMWMW